MKVYGFDNKSFMFNGVVTEATPGDVPGSWVHPLYSTSIEPIFDNVAPGNTLYFNMVANVWEEGPMPDSADLRREAYIEEADPILAQANGYLAEATTYEENGNTELANETYAKEREMRYLYVEKKEEIRERYPDNTTVDTTTETVVEPTVE